jgi:hypothetical protein
MNLRGARKSNDGMNSYANGDQSAIVGKSGLSKEQLLQEIFEDVYKNTPELEREMPKKNSKILNGISFKAQKPNQPAQKTIVSGKFSHLLLLYLNLLPTYFLKNNVSNCIYRCRMPKGVL